MRRKVNIARIKDSIWKASKFYLTFKLPYIFNLANSFRWLKIHILFCSYLSHSLPLNHEFRCSITETSVMNVLLQNIEAFIQAAVRFFFSLQQPPPCSSTLYGFRTLYQILCRRFFNTSGKFTNYISYFIKLRRCK